MLKEVSWCRVVCLLFLVGRGMLIYSGKNKCIYLEGEGIDMSQNKNSLISL